MSTPLTRIFRFCWTDPKVSSVRHPGAKSKSENARIRGTISGDTGTIVFSVNHQKSTHTTNDITKPRRLI